MTVDINLGMLQEVRNAYNKKRQETDSITLTHVLIKAVAIVLKDFPALYGFFDGSKIKLSDKLKINLPVSEGNHVEYVVIESPEIKSLPDIASEVREEVERIRSGIGTFYLILKKLFRLPKLIRSIVTNMPLIYLQNTYKNYGNFPITNFGSFGVKNGIPVISAPIISALCLGMIQDSQNDNAENSRTTKPVMSVTMVFDHRPIDGAYCGKFLKSLKNLIECNANSIFI